MTTPAGAGAPDDADGWNPWTAVPALISALVIAIVLGVVINEIVSPDPHHPSHASNLIATYLQDVVFVLVPIWFAMRVAIPRARSFGLRWPRISVGQWVAVVVGGYGLFLLFSAAWARALNLHEHQHELRDLGARDGHTVLVVVAILLCVAAPIGEEILFRGYMYRSLRNWRGVWPAALIVGPLFGAVHVASAPIGDLLPLAVFGVMLCIAYELSGSLYVSITLHAANNALAFLSLEHASAGWYPALLAMTLVALAVVRLGIDAVWPDAAAAPRP